MNSWRKLMGLSLLAGTLAAGCVITSDEDDDDGAAAGASGSDTGGSAGSGGSTAGTGGSTAGTGGSTAGTGGGSAGSPAGCSLDSIMSPNECEMCMRDNCCTLYDECTGDCASEFADFQECVDQTNTDNGVVLEEDVERCSAAASVNGLYPTVEAVALLDCLTVQSPDCSLPCIGVDPVSLGGAGGMGAGGAPAQGGAGGAM